MRSLLVEYDKSCDFAIITPVKRCNLESFNQLLLYLHNCWNDNGYHFDDKCQFIMQRISNLLPRLDVDNNGIDVNLLNTESLEGLFIGEIKNGELYPSKLIRLNEFEIKQKKAKKPGEDLTPSDIPIPSSGIEEADLIATLIGCDDSVDGAMQLFSSFDAEMLNGIIYYLNEMRRDPQERMNEYLKEQFDEWKRENQTTYHDALFG